MFKVDKVYLLRMRKNNLQTADLRRKAELQAKVYILNNILNDISCNFLCTFLTQFWNVIYEAEGI